MNNSAHEAVARLESEIRAKFREIEQICDDNKINFYWNGMTEYGYDAADYTHDGTWYSSGLKC